MVSRKSIKVLLVLAVGFQVVRSVRAEKAEVAKLQ